MLKQQENSPLGFHQQALVLYAGINWYLDKLNLEDIAIAEQHIYAKLDTTYIWLRDQILSDKKLTPDIESWIKTLLNEVVNEMLSA
jgi:F-type H+-transporting ATPase subunit alpha